MCFFIYYILYERSISYIRSDSSKDDVEVILNEWLKSMHQLSLEWVIDLQKEIKGRCISTFLPDIIDFRINTIYFSLDLPPNHVSWISILVDEETTCVLNNRLEYKGRDVYFSSKMTLREYIDWIHENEYRPEVCIQEAIVNNFNRCNISD